MSKFRKKPVVIEAWKWDESLATKNKLVALGMKWCRHNGHVDHPDLCKNLSISTLEGVMRVEPGDWIIKGVAGEFYPCKPDIFAATYEAVSDDGKAQRPEESAQAPLGRSEHTPTPEGRGVDLEAINFLLDSIERDEAGLVIFDQPGVNRGAVSTLLDFHVPALLRALSSPRVEDVRREALEEAAKVADEHASLSIAEGMPVCRECCEQLSQRIRSLSLQVE